MPTSPAHETVHRDDEFWQPNTDVEFFRRRSAIVEKIRAYFFGSGAVEVDTPLLGRCSVTDPGVQGIAVPVGLDGDPGGRSELYLQTSPEFAMKRLLAAGSGSIFQICKAFRGEEAGVRHSLEFTLLEWYRPGYDHHRLMDDVDELLAAISGFSDSRKHAYRELFAARTGVDLAGADDAQLRRHAARIVPGAVVDDSYDRADCLDLIFSHVIAPRLGTDMPEYVYDYPIELAALARCSPADPRYAERFELFIHGMEIANGFHELLDAEEQRSRFVADNARRQKQNRPERAIDERLLAALRHGLPACAGVALGLDRLLMVVLGKNHIREVQCFELWQA